MALSVDAEMLRIFTAELQLCKVSAGENIAILSGSERQSYVPALMLAARNLGAHVFHLNVLDSEIANTAGVVGQSPFAGNKILLDTLKNVDMVIDLYGLLFSPEQLEIQKAGTRILLILEPLHILRQLFPTEDHRRRVEFGEEMIKNARELRVTSAAGTDVRYGLSQYPVVTQYGYTDTPGRWDHFPSAFVFTQGNDGEVNGTVVLAPGDILTSFKRYVQEPITLHIKEGFVTSIEGEGLDAEVVRDYMASFNDPRAYAIAHIGWGLHEKATWYRMFAAPQPYNEGITHALSFYGNVLFSTGPNTELGGSNDTLCHLDIPLRNCSLFLDNRQVVDAGRVVVPELMAPGR